MYNILIVDDSALMRKHMCDIINSIQGFHAADICADGESALRMLASKKYDAATMNIHLSRMTGLEVLKQLKAKGSLIPIVAISSSIKEDREVTVSALDSGAVDLVVRPYHFRTDEDLRTFSQSLKNALMAAVNGSRTLRFKSTAKPAAPTGVRKPAKGSDDSVSVATFTSNFKKRPSQWAGQYKLVAIACSTGGPQALHTMIPKLPEHIGVPVVVVQHMPKGFTASLAERIDSDAKVHVKEAEDGEILKPDWIYIAPGGRHLTIEEKSRGVMKCHVYDGPPVNNLRPCADVMYDSLRDIMQENILCVVMTGMGADGSKGIAGLRQAKRVYTITQDEASCVVYGMPKSAAQMGLSDEVVPLSEIANSISKELGV